MGDEKFWVRGVTYGTFRPAADGTDYPPPDVVAQDFAEITANGLNAIRTYSVPPQWLLDTAQRHGLRVMVGISWEQHIAVFDDTDRVRSIAKRVRQGVRACVSHPAILCYAIGNEIPAPIVRWHGHRRVERYLAHLYHAAKAEDPDGLFTYVNYPSTEYLQSIFDLVSFNVYLESEDRFAAYLARIQNIAGDRPLIITEIGLDSRRHGEEAQAQALDWQLHAAFASGCAGAFVFAWTDEWHRGGYDIDDWDFGLTRRDRRPKPALAAVRRAFAEVPFPAALPWPRVSVIVCSHNGGRWIRDCLGGLRKLDYPNFEVIVVDDGSTDATADIGREYGVRLISTENRGLSSARNAGLSAATGEIVAYIDDDAYPDPHWLRHLAATFLRTPHAGVGGPNVPPQGDELIAECVASAPGGPNHVLLTDQQAEHIPGCNMAFRKTNLQAVGGFDPQFTTAGDDVDICWRFQQRGWTLGFSPGAMVWHHRRNSVKAYWQQQVGYGRAEAMLERKWPEKYNPIGHLNWAGRVYGRAIPQGSSRGRIYHGIWGAALFQSVYQPTSGLPESLPAIPEWYLVNGVLVGLSLLGLLWPPLRLAFPLLIVALGALLVCAVRGGFQAPFSSVRQSHMTLLQKRLLTSLLYLLQPLARLRGRMASGLTIWRRRGVQRLAAPWPRTFCVWSERWQSSAERLQSMEAIFATHRVISLRGGNYDTWDLEVRDGPLGVIRILMAIEEHGAGQQLVRVRAWPRTSPEILALILLFVGLAAGAALDRVWAVSIVLGAAAGILALRVVQNCAAAMAVVTDAFALLTRESGAGYSRSWSFRHGDQLSPPRRAS